MTKSKLFSCFTGGGTQVSLGSIVTLQGFLARVTRICTPELAGMQGAHPYVTVVPLDYELLSRRKNKHLGNLPANQAGKLVSSWFIREYKEGFEDKIDLKLDGIQELCGESDEGKKVLQDDEESVTSVGEDSLLNQLQVEAQVADAVAKAVAEAEAKYAWLYNSELNQKLTRLFRNKIMNKPQMWNLSYAELAEVVVDKTVCEYTGLPMYNPYLCDKQNHQNFDHLDGERSKDSKIGPEYVTLERVDSRRPYEKGNVIAVRKDINTFKGVHIDPMTKSDKVSLESKISILEYTLRVMKDELVSK